MNEDEKEALEKFDEGFRYILSGNEHGGRAFLRVLMTGLLKQVAHDLAGLVDEVIHEDLRRAQQTCSEKFKEMPDGPLKDIKWMREFIRMREDRVPVTTLWANVVLDFAKSLNDANITPILSEEELKFHMAMMAANKNESDD